MALGAALLLATVAMGLQLPGRGGEIGLGGEIRQVAHTPRRLAEVARLDPLTGALNRRGFADAVVIGEVVAGKKDPGAPQVYCR